MYLTQKNWLYPWEIIPSNKKMTNIVYLDIYDINILQRLSDKKTHLVIGIDEVFLKALEACTSWELYDINYTSCIEEQIIRNEQPISTLSAIGLLKRILHMATRHQIFFLFKSYFETQNVNKRFLEKVFSQSATIRLQIDPYSHLNNLSHQLRCAFYEVIQMEQKFTLINFELNDRSNVKRKFQTNYIFNQLKQMSSNHCIDIVFSEKMSEKIYAFYDLKMASFDRTLNASTHASIIEEIQESWLNDAFMIRL